MAQREKQKKRKRSVAARHRRRNRTTMFAIIGVVVMLFFVLVYQGNVLEQRIADSQQKLAALETQLAAEQKRTEDIDDLKEYMQSSEFVEKIAKEKIGLVKENEILFKESE